LNTRTFSGDRAGAYIRPLIENAKKSLWIISPWVGKDYARLLVALSQKDVEVRLITSKNDFNIESIDILKASENPNLHFLVMDNDDPNQKTAFIHSKIYLADKREGISGSANLTYSGLNTNVESLNIAVTEKDLLQIENDFMSIWLKYEKGAMSKEALSSTTSFSIRNALPLPYLGFIDQPHIEKKDLVFYPYFFCEFKLRATVKSTPLVFEDHDFLVIDGINRQIINNDKSLIQEINNKTPKDYILKTDNKYNIENKTANLLNPREAHELALDYIVKKNTKKYTKFYNDEGEAKYYVPQGPDISIIKEYTQFYGDKRKSCVFVPQPNDISFIKEYFVQVPIWYLEMYEPDGKHQKIMLASSGNVWNDSVYCPICQNKISMKDSVTCTLCNKALCQKCTRDTGILFKKKYCPSCYQNLPPR
jgi:hypothetical protein